jgi:hypothetical protein
MRNCWRCSRGLTVQQAPLHRATQANNCSVPHFRYIANPQRGDRYDMFGNQLGRQFAITIHLQ